MLYLGIESPDMFRGQLGMPPPVQYPTYGDEYENLKGKSIEEIRLELNNTNLNAVSYTHLTLPTILLV